MELETVYNFLSQKIPNLEVPHHIAFFANTKGAPVC